MKLIPQAKKHVAYRYIHRSRAGLQMNAFIVILFLPEFILQASIFYRKIFLTLKPTTNYVRLNYTSRQL